MCRSRSAASNAARVLAKLGAKKGGKASAAALTPEQRQARARAAVAARWQAEKGDELPIDQQAVMNRLSGVDKETLRIAPGAGGSRRRAAIDSLVKKGKITVIDAGVDSVTIAHAITEKRKH